MKVFFSWQSDLNHETHTKFIRQALVAAMKQVSTDLELEEAERLELDEAAKDRKGAENIVSALLKKIENAAIFVVDVTPVAKLGDKLLTNPNVTYELGWATAKIGYESVILVMNTAEGHKPKDMPFDIAQRPIIQYQLKNSPTDIQRQRAYDRLTEHLAGALTVETNLAREKSAAEADISGAPASDRDFSIWKADRYELIVDGPFRTKPRHVRIVSGPRAYIRVIPQSWSKGVPAVHGMEAASPSIWPPNAASGDWTRCEQGFARFHYQHPANDDDLRTGNVSMYFDETGEYWVLDDSFLHQKNGVYFFPEKIVGHWRVLLAQINRLFDALGASATRRVEVGINGTKGAYGYALGGALLCHKPFFKYATQEPVWTDDVQISFLEAAYRQITNALALPQTSREDFLKLLPNIPR